MSESYWASDQQVSWERVSEQASDECTWVSNEWVSNQAMSEWANEKPTGETNEGKCLMVFIT